MAKKISKQYLLGLDVGGTKVECILIKILEDNGSQTEGEPIKIEDHQGLILTRERIPTNRDRGIEPVMKDIADLVMRVLDQNRLDLDDVEGIGVGLPGTIDPATGTMHNGNSAIFVDRNFAEDLNELLPKKVKILSENDANCFALAEVLCGAGQDFHKHFDVPVSEQIGLGIIIGTGCGGGIIIKNHILQGQNGAGGELGHTELITDGRPCYCGRSGCAEKYLSGSGLEMSYAALTKKALKPVKSKEIFELAAQGDPIANETIQKYKAKLCKFLINLSNIFDPHYFVLGGGISCQDTIYPGLEDMIADGSFVPDSSPVVLKHQLGDSSGVIGAAMLLLD